MSDEQKTIKPGTDNEGGLTDEQLLDFSREHAEQQLTDEQLKRYNELKENKLKGAIDEKKVEDGLEATEGLAALREATENELTVEVHGIEFLADIDPSQLDHLADVARFEDRKVEDLNEDEINKIRSNLLDVLANLSVNFEREDWRREFGDAGLVTIGKITGDLLDKIEGFMSQKKSR